MGSGEVRSIVVKGGTVFNGYEVVGRRDVKISGKMVVEIGVGLTGDVEVDARDSTVMPGLVDAHFHFMGMRGGDIVRGLLLEDPKVRLLRAARWASRMLEAGITTVRDCGEPNALPLRRAIAEGTVDGPTIYAAGPPLSQTFGHGDLLHSVPIQWNTFSEICDGVDSCRAAARRVLRMGADFVKVMATGGVVSERDRPEWPQLSLEELRAIVWETAKVGTHVAAHAHGDRGARLAVEAGVLSIEHGTLLTMDTVKSMAEKGVVLVPTLTIQHVLYRYGKQLGLNEWALEKIVEVKENAPRVIQMARELGVTVLAGTDLFFETGLDIDIGKNWVEAVLLVEEGSLSPVEALRAATSNVRRLGIKAGSIEAGERADVVVVDGDPTSDIRDLGRVKHVVKEGKIVK